MRHAITSLGIEQERLFVFVLSMTHGMQHFFRRIFPPLIPLLVVDFGIPLWKLGMLVTVHGFAGGIGQAPFGFLSDRYDRRYILPTGVVAVGVGFLIVAASPVIAGGVPALHVLGQTIEGPLLVMAFGMALAGVGKSATHPTGYPLITANVTPENKGKVLGRWGSASKIGDAAAPLTVALLILVLSWQQIFAFVAVAGIAYGLFLYVFMTTSDLVTTPPNQRSDEPAADDTGTGYRSTILIVLLFSLFVGIATSGIGTYLPTFITDVYGYTVTMFGTTLGPESVASLYYAAALGAGGITALYMGTWSDTYDPRTLLLSVFAIATGILVVLGFVPLSPLRLLAVAVVTGAVLFGFTPLRDALMTSVVPDPIEGRVFGMFWTSYLLIRSVYPVLIGYIGDVAGIQRGFQFLSIGTFLAACAVLFLYRDDALNRALRTP